MHPLGVNNVKRNVPFEKVKLLYLFSECMPFAEPIRLNVNAPYGLNVHLRWPNCL